MPAADDGADIFDGAVLLDERHRDEGYQEGLRDGKPGGLREGRSLGAEKGFHLAQEVGYIAGCCGVWRAAELPPRAARGVEALALQVAAFPLDDPSSLQIDEALADLKAKFKAVVAMMGLTADFFPKEDSVQTSF
mmetsp:Transcript_31923/g.81739  ORF Transcript_31923/g.81739 Transcript_31923/m.81739 type:complete len:135 (-) Transcript_31923:137-541(-)